MVGFILFVLLVWIVIPLIILSMFIFSLIIVFATRGTEQRISVRAAFFAGLLLFVIYAFSQLQTIHDPSISFDLTGFNQTDLIVATVSFIIGFMLLWGIQIIIPLRVLGIIT